MNVVVVIISILLYTKHFNLFVVPVVSSLPIVSPAELMHQLQFLVFMSSFTFSFGTTI